MTLLFFYLHLILILLAYLYNNNIIIILLLFLLRSVVFGLLYLVQLRYTTRLPSLEKSCCIFFFFSFLSKEMLNLLSNIISH